MILKEVLQRTDVSKIDLAPIKKGAIKKGSIFLAKFEEHPMDRLVVIVQNDRGNGVSPTTIVACLNSTEPTLLSDCTQIRTIDKSRLTYKVGDLSKKELDTYLDARILNMANNLGGMSND